MDKEIVKIKKLVFGGQGIGIVSDGRKVFVWNALPGEKVALNITSKKQDYLEAFADKIIEPSRERVLPKEDNYLSTSPWQIMSFEAENKYKKDIIQEVFQREKVDLPSFKFVHTNKMFNYRNKMEYSFWGDDSGLHLALHKRGSRGKQIVSGSKLAMQVVDEAANLVLEELKKHKIRASDLKSIVIRTNQIGDTVASLYVKSRIFVKLSLPKGLKGLSAFYSDPKSPASVSTKLLYQLGKTTLKDKLLDKSFEYKSDSFFQINLPIFKQVLSVIKKFVNKDAVIDMYGGVGSIGLSVSKNPVIVELDDATVVMAKHNAVDTNAKVVHASTEKALEYIVSNRLLIVDPPRAGLHKHVIERILKIMPKKVIYLSCNPITQARDIKLLKSKYKISFFEGYNFFPRTPHIETLTILELV